MDSMGDAAELHDDDLPALRPPLVTPEALALTGLILVVTGTSFGALFQFLSFVVIENYDAARTQAGQYLIYAGPVAVLALVGASLGRRAAQDPACAPWARHVGGAAVVSGLLIAAVVAVGIVLAFAFGANTAF